MRWHWLDRQLGACYFTFLEIFRAVSLRRAAPFLAAVLLVVVGGIALMILLDALFVLSGKMVWPVSQLPRSIAGVAILGGYYVWDRFAAPERVRLWDSLDFSSTPERRHWRRLKVVAFVVSLAAAYLMLTES